MGLCKHGECLYNCMVYCGDGFSKKQTKTMSEGLGKFTTEYLGEDDTQDEELLELSKEDVGEYIKALGVFTREWLDEKKRPNANWGKYHNYNEQKKDWEIVENYLAFEGGGIKSVKRLSDNIVFSVGEKFSNNGAGIYTEETIASFEIVNNAMRVFVKESDGYYLLEHLQKVKQLLFTKEEVIEIIEKHLRYR